VGEKPMLTLHAQVIPPYDHDALLHRIHDYLRENYQIAHATVQMEYQPCAGAECELGSGSAAATGHDHSHSHDHDHGPAHVKGDKHTH
jgi:cobalt-zinc-cadmium efflux system protein